MTVGIAWTEHAEPLVRERVEQAARLFPLRQRVAVELNDGPQPIFRREVADVHRTLFAERAADYGEDVRIKIEHCLRVNDAEVASGRREREEYRARWAEAIEDVDLVVTPTLPCVAPLVGAGAPGDLGVRETLIRFTIPFNTLGAPALALPCGPAEDGLPASVQLAARPGEDGLVLAAGRLLEALL